MNQAGKLGVSFLLFAVCSVLIASCSKCGKTGGPESKQPGTQAGSTAAMATAPMASPAMPPQEGTGKKLSPEEFYKLMFERQEISLDFQKKRLALLKKHGSFTEEARQELMKINSETAQAQRAVMDKYGINYIDLRNAMQDPEMQKANNEYMRSHPEIQEKFKQNREKQMELSKELQPYEEKIRQEMQKQSPAGTAPTAPVSTPPPAQKPAQ